MCYDIFIKPISIQHLSLVKKPDREKEVVIQSSRELSGTKIEVKYVKCQYLVNRQPNVREMKSA